MCTGNLEGLCVRKIEVENKPQRDMFTGTLIEFSKQEIRCHTECNGYNNSCPIYQAITTQYFRNLTSLSAAS